MDVNNRDGDRRWCCFHPREVVIGVCALCLNERLLVIAPNKRSAGIHRTNNKIYGISPKMALPKIIALTGNLLTRLDIAEGRHQKSDEVYQSSSTSQEDSFISIKFEENGVASWDRGKPSNNIEPPNKKSNNHIHDKANNKKVKSTVIEQLKPRGTASMTWRKRIGHLLQLIKLKKRSNKGSIGHVGTKLEGSKVRYGWIRNLTNKTRTKE